MKVSRGLDKALFAKLVAGDWIARHQSLLICGPTGTGKSWRSGKWSCFPPSFLSCNLVLNHARQAIRFD
jgi:hypothetical protein